jgi:hypothetical protein
MAKRNTRTPSEPPTDNDQGGEPDAPAYNPFLKPADLAGGATFTLTGWSRELDGQFGKQIVVEVKQHDTGKVFDFAFKDGSPNHRELFQRGGGNRANWKGVLDLTVKQGTYGPYIAIDKIPF